MQRTCPECSLPLPTGRLTAICPACAWRMVFEPTHDSAFQGNGPALFHVAGHDVLAEIARGGAGIVYRARQLNPPREVALKMLLPQQLGSDEMITRFRIEAETIAALDHPAILPVYAVGLHQEVPYFTMKLAAGGTLTQRGATFHGNWRMIAELVATLADAVQFAHSRGVIHRDVKPGNILFDESDRPFLSDFGLAKYEHAGASITRTLNLMGTPAYLAPEVAQLGAHAATTASDVYALGSVLYELLARRPPFAADSLAVLLKDVAETPPQPLRQKTPDIPFDLEVICLRCLAKAPEKRLGSAAELAAELRRWLAGVPIQSRPVSALERSWQWCRRRPALSALTALLALTVVGAGFAQWFANRSLTRALAAAQTAQRDAQQKLQASLLSEGKLRSRSRLMGQRHGTLEILERAAHISATPEVRSEYASALSRADLKLVRELPGSFPDNITTIDFSPDLDTYAIPDPGGGFVLRASADGRILQRFAAESKSPARNVRFTADGKGISVTFSDGRVEIWSMEHEKPIWTATVEGNATVIFALHPSRSSVAYRSSAGEIRLRDFDRGTERILVAADTPVYALSFDPAGKRLAVARDASVDLHDAVDGSRLWTRNDVPLTLSPVWSPDGKMLLTGNRTRHTITIRDSATGAITAQLAGHNAFPVDAQFLPDGKRVVTLGFDATLSLWDLPTARELLQAPVAHRGFALSADGRRMGAVSKSDKPALFEWADEAVFREFKGSFRVAVLPAGFAISPDGEWLVTLGVDTLRREVRGQSIMLATIWDARREQEAATYSFRSGRDDQVSIMFDSATPAIVYSFSPNGSWPGGIWRRDLHVDADRKLRVSAETRIAAVGTHALLRIDPNGDWVVQRLPGKSLAIWPKGDASRETELPLPADPSEFRIQIDRHYLVGRDPGDATVRLWSRGTGATIGKLALPWPAWVAFSPLDDRMVVGNNDSYRTWTLPGLEPGPEWPTRPEVSSWKCFSFSASGRWFACGVGGGSIEIRDGRTFALLAHLEPPLDLEMTGLLWSPDETRIYLMFRGPRIFVWELPALRRELAARGLDW